jgi:hypothetical protein
MADNKIIKKLNKTFKVLVEKVRGFDVVDKKLLPYGLKPHTRSVSWIAEQVILQQAKTRIKELGFDEVVLWDKDTN